MYKIITNFKFIIFYCLKNNMFGDGDMMMGAGMEMDGMMDMTEGMMLT